jgi:hypothetical protein
MILILRNLAVLCFALIPTSQVLGQPIAQEGVQSNDLARMVSVKASLPVLGACRKDSTRCFRLLIEMAPREGGQIGVSSIIGGGNPYVAYSAGGAECRGAVIGGVERGGYDGVRQRWNLDRLTFVETSKPGIAILEFACDNDLLPQEEVTIQANFDLYINARVNGEGRYVFSRVKLQQR